MCECKRNSIKRNRRFKKLGSVGNIFKETDYAKQLKEYNKDYNEEFESLKFFDGIENLIACANIKSSSFVYNQKPILYFEACMDILPGEQLGISYSKTYWLKRNIHPEIFYSDGSVVPQDKYHRNFSDEKSVKSLFVPSDQIFRGIFNKPVNDNDEQMRKLKKLYKLSDNFTSQELEKGLRMAAANNKPNDIKFFSRMGANIDAQDATSSSFKTALHHAIIKQFIPCIHALLELGARYNINDASGKTALDYANESNSSEIKNIFFEESYEKGLAKKGV